SEYLTDEQLDNIQDYSEKELDRISGYNSGSFTFYNNADGFANSGITYDITNGSNYTSTFYRDADGYVTSGVLVELGKTISFVYYRDANKIVISGLRTVA
ncbi:MAG TPA: hypothetical protein VI790_06255, partial [Candidatus Nanoarchaeia archaeon]|nr:hypothetical protein [Candidatus Nanoarchaeia archaeon]